MSDLEAQSPTPPLHAEDLEDEIANIIDWAKEEEIGSGELAEHILQAVADALLAGLPEKHEPENRHLSTDNGGFIGNYCNRCKIFTFDKDTFEETGAWCLCYPYNEALDAVTRVIGELGGRDD